MRVALFSAYYPSHGGGMELACAELAQLLLAAGIGVVWVAQEDEGQTDGREEIYSPVPGTDIVYRLSGIPMPLPMPRAIRKMDIEVARADAVIVAEANFALSVLAYGIAKLRRKRILLIQHVGRPSTLSRLARGVMTLGERLIVRPMVRNADAVVCVSPVVASHFAAVAGKGPRVIIGHAIDTARFRPSTNAQEGSRERTLLGLPQVGRIACYVGRLTESKGLLVLRELARIRSDWTFAIAGSGPIDPADWRQANVRVLGQLNRDEVAMLLRVSDCTVLPSQSESFSLVVREALAAECRVVCADQVLETDLGLEPYLITERMDLSAPAETAARLSGALDGLSESSGVSAREYVQRVCSPKAIGEQYLGIIQGFIAAPERRG